MANNNGIGIKVGLDLQTNQGIKDFNDWSNTVQAQAQKKPIKINVELDGQKWTKSIETFIGKNGDLVESTKYVNLATQAEYERITKVENAFDRLQRATSQQTEQNNRLTASHNNLNTHIAKSTSLFQDFTATFMKMAKFNTINMIYDGIINSISGAIEITNEFNRATTELKKVSDLSGQSLSEYTEQLSEYGEAVGRTMTEMTSSATIFKRTGATDEEAAQLAQISELYKNVADSEISSAEASSFLVSQMKAFNYTADESIHVIDSVNSVANHFAVSTDDLQTALSKSAAAMATAGNSFEETISLVEAGTAIMQGQAGTVGNGLRTIAINVANLATKSDEFVAANGKVKISLKDANGEIKSTYQVLNDLAQSWNKLNRAEQNEIATTLAGKHKYKSLVLLAINLFNCSNYLTTL